MAETALIVGTGAGLSASLARLFHKEGMRVALAARRTDKLAALCTETNARAYACPMRQSPIRSRRSSEAVTKDIATLDIVVYNASGRARGGPIADLKPDEVLNAIMIGCYGGFLVGQQAAKAMLKAGHGTILFTGASASVKGFPLSSAFAMGKFGLRGLTQSMASGELAPQNIHVAHFVIDGGIRRPARRFARPRIAALMRCSTRMRSRRIISSFTASTAAPGPPRSNCRPWVEKCASRNTEPSVADPAVTPGLAKKKRSRPQRRERRRFGAFSNNRPWIMTAAVVCIFMTAIEGTVVATAMPTIVGQLGTDFHLFTWVFSTYFLTQAVAIPLSGRFADLFGRKPLLFFGLTLFLLGSSACGFAPNMLALILFRVVQGIGAGRVMPVTQTLISDIYPPAERARIQGYLSSIWASAAICGPLLGAVIVTDLSWRWVFWVNVPLGIAAFILLATRLHEQRARRGHQIDYLGSVLMASSIGLWMFSLNQATSFGLTVFLGLLAISLLLLALLYRHELKSARAGDAAPAMLAQSDRPRRDLRLLHGRLDHHRRLGFPAGLCARASWARRR